MQNILYLKAELENGKSNKQTGTLSPDSSWAYPATIFQLRTENVPCSSIRFQPEAIDFAVSRDNWREYIQKIQIGQLVLGPITGTIINCYPFSEMWVRASRSENSFCLTRLYCSLVPQLSIGADTKTLEFCRNLNSRSTQIGIRSL